MSRGRGYDWSSGMSVNAAAAHSRGELPAGAYARMISKRIGAVVSKQDAERACDYIEHHTSARFNATRFIADTRENELAVRELIAARPALAFRPCELFGCTDLERVAFQRSDGQGIEIVFER